MSELAKKYKEEYDEDATYDRITLMSKLETVASIANKWAFRLYQHRERLEKLKDKKIDLLINVELSMEDSNDKRLKNKSEAAKKVIIARTDTIRAIDRKISEEERIVDYLGEISKNSCFVLSRKLGEFVELLKVETFG